MELTLSAQLALQNVKDGLVPKCETEKSHNNPNYHNIHCLPDIEVQINLLSNITDRKLHRNIDREYSQCFKSADHSNTLKNTI